MRQTPLYLLMLMLSALDLAGTGAFYFSLHEIKASYSLSEIQLNLLIFPPAIITIILITQNCRLLDTLGRKKFVSLSLAIYAASCLLGFFASDFYALLAARCAMAVGAATFVTTARNLTYELQEPEERMRGIKYYASGLAIGMALGPYIASNISGNNIFQGAFGTLGLMSIACIIINSLTDSKQPDSQPAPKDRYQSFSSVATMLSPLVFLLFLLTIAPISFKSPDTTALILTIAAAWTICAIAIYGASNRTEIMSRGAFP